MVRHSTSIFGCITESTGALQSPRVHYRVHGFVRESTVTLKDPHSLPWQVIFLSNRLKSTQGPLAKP